MSLPVIRGASAALYPYTMTISFQTEISEWQNGAQERKIQSQGLVMFDLPYGQLTKAQKNTVLSFITSAKGRSNNTESLTIGSTTYTNFYQVADEWSATESIPKEYAGPIRLAQAIPQGLGPGTPGTAFPTLANGAMCLLPFVQKKRFQTVFQKVAAGPTYAYAEFGGGLTGYPSDGLMAWELPSQNVLADADTATLIAHFISNYGRAYSFPFTDEDGLVYANTHYAMDEMVITYRGVNDSSVRVMLEATN